jgi:uncharacterized protein YdiU (UPF0061 family)
MKTGRGRAKVEGDGYTVEVNMPIIIFEEDQNTILYCAPLDLSGYGKDEAEAKQSLEVALDEFFKYCIHKNTLRIELKRLGWHLKKSKRKPMVPPTMEELLKNNSDFSHIFNTVDFRKIATSVAMPAIA